jgi:hypothetical protein
MSLVFRVDSIIFIVAGKSDKKREKVAHVRKKA